MSKSGISYVTGRGALYKVSRKETRRQWDVGKKKDMKTSKVIQGKRVMPSSGTKPSQKNYIGSMTREMKTISRGVKAIANRTGKPRQKVHKYTVGELGKAAHQPTARK